MQSKVNLLHNLGAQQPHFAPQTGLVNCLNLFALDYARLG